MPGVLYLYDDEKPASVKSVRGTLTSSPRVKNQSYTHIPLKAFKVNCEGGVEVNHHTIPTHVREEKLTAAKYLETHRIEELMV